MSLMETFETAVEKASRVIALVGLALLLSLAFATALDVLLRWVLNSPITGVRDLSSLFIAVAITASFPICLTEQSNVTIRFFGIALGPRCRKVFDIFGHIVTLGFVLMTALQLWWYADELFTTREFTWVLQWPVAPWYYVVAIIFGFLAIVQIAVILRSIRLPAASEPPRNQ